jgi:hypothetical protein
VEESVIASKTDDDNIVSVVHGAVDLQTTYYITSSALYLGHESLAEQLLGVAQDAEVSTPSTDFMVVCVEGGSCRMQKVHFSTLTYSGEDRTFTVMNYPYPDWLILPTWNSIDAESNAYFSAFE